MKLSHQEVLNFDEDTHSNYIHDGVYDVSNIEVMLIPEYRNTGEYEEEIAYFEENAINLHMAKPYQLDTLVFMSDKPTPLPKEDVLGRGFNYGSCNLITNCPSSILILAEDD